jgi:hypothetical protein
MKTICAGQNLEVRDMITVFRQKHQLLLQVKERVWPILRDEGMVVEEAEDDEDDVEEEKVDEKGVVLAAADVAAANLFTEKSGTEWTVTDGLDVR